MTSILNPPESGSERTEKATEARRTYWFASRNSTVYSPAGSGSQSNVTVAGSLFGTYFQSHESTPGCTSVQLAAVSAE